MKIVIKKITPLDTTWIRTFFKKHWGADFIVSRGKIHKVEELEGFVAKLKEKTIGLITYKTKDREVEIISLDSLRVKHGIGSALLQKTINHTKRQGTKRVWLITTNNNLNAIEFYRKRNFQIIKTHKNAIDLSRKLKPQIPFIDGNGTPIKDEIEMEYVLKNAVFENHL